MSWYINKIGKASLVNVAFKDEVEHFAANYDKTNPAEAQTVRAVGVLVDAQLSSLGDTLVEVIGNGSHQAGSPTWPAQANVEVKVRTLNGFLVE